MAVYTSRGMLICAIPAVAAIVTMIWFMRKKRSTELINKEKMHEHNTAGNFSSTQISDGNEKKQSSCSSDAKVVEPAVLLETSVGAFSRISKNDVNIFDIQLNKKNIFEVQDSLESKCSIIKVPEIIDAKIEKSKLDKQLPSNKYETNDIVQDRNENNVIKLPVISQVDVTNSDVTRTSNEDLRISNQNNAANDKNEISVGESGCQSSLSEVVMKVTFESSVQNTLNTTIKEDEDSEIVEIAKKDDELGQNDNSMQPAVTDETGNNSSQGHYSDVQSEDSSDSGKGGSDSQQSTEFAHFPMPDDGLSVYEFELPQELCGRLIGRQGKSVNYIKNHSNANVFIKKHPTNPRMKLCTIEGNALEIGAALELIRRRFPPSQFPNVTLAQFNTNGNTRGVPIPETLQLSWLNQSCLLFQRKLLPFHSHFQNASVYHHITEIQLHLPEAVSCDVLMSSMVTASHFFLQQPTHPTYPNLSRLDNCMAACYTQMETPQLPRPVEAGVICAAPVMSGWYRTQVVYVCENMEECDVKFVDYGGYSRVPISSLRQIRSDFMTLPFQASECYLSNVQSMNDDGSWSIEACATFEELAQGHILQAQIVGYAEDSVPFVHLYKLQGISTIFINRELVNRGVAQWIEHQ